MNRHDVIIAGGGLNGPMLALALARAGLAVAVVDAAPPRARGEAGFDGRAYALAVASQRMLAALGLWGMLAPRAQPIRHVKAAQAPEGERADPFFVHFDSSEIEEGPVGWMVEDRHLSRALTDAMAEAGVTHLHATVAGHQADTAGVTVQTSGGDLAGALIVGADGRASATAARAGIRRRGWDYGQTALVASIGHEADHAGTAHQLFLPGGPLAILPLAGGHCSSIVWSLPRAEAAAIAALDDADFLAVLAPRFGDFLGALRLEGPRFGYPLNLTLAETYIAPRMALIGDAAHGVHPIAGQGLNLGLRDVAALAECVVDAHRRGEDIGGDMVLERYQRWRRFDSTAMALGMDGVNRLFSNTNPILRAARGLGMGVVQALPGLRRGLMRQAAGLGLPGQTPRLLTGRAL